MKISINCPSYKRPKVETLNYLPFCKVWVCETEYEEYLKANPKYKEALEKAGMIISGESNGLIEAVELQNHPWFVGVQFHPEFTSHWETPNPIILDFVRKANSPK